MCVIEPSKRATVTELMSDPWVQMDGGPSNEEE
jgi:hypothetical protein